VPLRRTAVEALTQQVPDLEAGDEAYLRVFEDEAEILGETPSRAQIEELFRNKWFRYYMARLKSFQNGLVNSAFSQPAADWDYHRGVVKGVRQALGFPRLVHLEALTRERGEPEEEMDGSDHDDFGRGLASAQGEE
jgi:hypothetical protein